MMTMPTTREHCDRLQVELDWLDSQGVKEVLNALRCGTT